MTQDTAYHPCPACSGNAVSDLTACSPTAWKTAACRDCARTYLCNPPVHAALKEHLAQENSSENRKATPKGSTGFALFTHKFRNTLRLYRDKTKSFRRWLNDGHVPDIGSWRGQRITAPMSPYRIELSATRHKVSDIPLRARGGYCQHGAGAQAIRSREASRFDGAVMFPHPEHEVDVTPRTGLVTQLINRITLMADDKISVLLRKAAA